MTKMRLSHVDKDGKAVMVDVSDKDVTDRVATARGAVLMAPETMRLIQAGGMKKGDVLSVARLAGIMGAKKTPELIPLCHPLALNAIAKGDVVATARLAGVMAAKRTGELIPLCHPLPLDFVDVRLAVDRKRGVVAIEAEARIVARTGIEMEALTAVTVAALTIYDMCKAVDRTMRLTDIRLTGKSGGRSGTFRAEEGGA